MQHRHRGSGWWWSLAGWGALLWSAGCDATLPSERLKQEVNLPVPETADVVPGSDRLQFGANGEQFVLTPRSLIPLAFEHQPDIKSSFQRFKSEEARYDFFYTSRDALTPRVNVTNDFSVERGLEEVRRTRDHNLEVGVEKLFFDTTEVDLATGYRNNVVEEEIGNHPFVRASVRYPLWVSRRKLERTSEDIFRRNELNDAQLNYIQQVRSRLEQAMFKFYEVVGLRRDLGHLEEYKEDLERLAGHLRSGALQDRAADRERIAAELARIGADHRNALGWYDIQLARLKGLIGLPFRTRIELSEEPFNPFEGSTHQDLLEMSIATDPEIATLQNALRNAEVQLDLARRGKWDVSLLLDAESSLEGSGEDESISDWKVATGIQVSAVDDRVTESLKRQARANIQRFSQAIAARENDIYVDTLEPIVRIETLGASRDELVDNLERYREDYAQGLRRYLDGELNIDDLLNRRQTVYDQQSEISRLTDLVGYNVAELCAATGKFFDLLDGETNPSSAEVEG